MRVSTAAYPPDDCASEQSAIGLARSPSCRRHGRHGQFRKLRGHGQSTSVVRAGPRARHALSAPAPSSARSMSSLIAMRAIRAASATARPEVGPAVKSILEFEDLNTASGTRLVARGHRHEGTAIVWIRGSPNGRADRWGCSRPNAVGARRSRPIPGHLDWPPPRAQSHLWRSRIRLRRSRQPDGKSAGSCPKRDRAVMKLP